MNVLTRIYFKIFEDRNFFEAIIYIFWYLLHRLCYLNIMRMCFLTPSDMIYDKSVFSCKHRDSQFEFKKISPHEIYHFDYNKNRISDNDIELGIKNGDILYIVTPKGDNKIISYGWYSFNPTVINQHFLLSFPKDFIYMYNGYTEPDYRGFRLHALGMQYATLDAPKLGRKGLVSFVNIENYRSVRSCKRLGYRFIGGIMVLNFLSKEYIFRSAKIKPLGINLTHYNLSPFSVIRLM